MSIRRGPRPDTRFYTVSKDISENQKMSWAARGLLIFLLGKPDNWEVSVAHLIKQTAESEKPSKRDAVYGLIQELKNLGYLQVDQAREKGAFKGVSYIVNEVPVSASPLTDLPYTAQPNTEEPYTDNPTLIKNEYKQGKNNLLNKDKKQKDSLEKNNSKAVSHDSNLNLNLSDKQIDYFANLLANDPMFGSTHAVMGESGKEFAARIKQMMKDPNWVAEHMDDLKAVGFGGAA